MSWKETLEPVLTRMPAVRPPEGHHAFRDKVKWTGGILVLYFFLTNIQLFGISEGSSGFYGYFSTILATSQGSLMQLGIGPIVTASIILQLLEGSGVLGIDKNDPRDQRIYQSLQKLLVFVMAVLTAGPMVYSGAFLKPNMDLAAALGIGIFGVQTLIFVQVVLGGVLIQYFDEVVSRWGVGSGVGLFIIAGISQKLFGGLFAFKPLTQVNGILPTWIGIIAGTVNIGSIFTAEGIRALIFGQGEILAVLTTVLILAIVVYAENVRVEVPISNARMSSARGRYPIKLIYASVMPMIFVRALQSNVQMFGKFLDKTVGLPAFIGKYSNGQAVSGLFYYLSPVRRPQDWMWWLASTTQEPWQILLRVFTDLSIMVFGGAVFAIFWIETTDMGPESVAEKVHSGGLQIDGFRRNASVLSKVFERYIPHVTVLGGAIVGALAVFANMLGTIGAVSGTGLLLTVSITYKLAEEIGEEHLKEKFPQMAELFG